MTKIECDKKKGKIFKWNIIIIFFIQIENKNIIHNYVIIFRSEKKNTGWMLL